MILLMIGFLFLWISYKLYRFSKEKEGVVVDSSKTFEQAHSEAVDKVKEE